MNSVLAANEYYQKWEVLFGDDGSPVPGRPIAETILRDHLDKVQFVQSNLTLEQKMAQGLMLGRYANQIMERSQADVAVVLCDDDMLHPLYLARLNEFLTNRSEVLYCYSKVSVYNPLLGTPGEMNESNVKYNDWNGPIAPAGKLDIAQVAWRLSCWKDYGARFADSTNMLGKDTDRSWFESLAEKCGLCYPTGFVGQYKGIHDYQLVWHKKGGVTGLSDYDSMCRELAGVEL